ncbi:MAG: DUF2155 domain-containing protein [Hyphomicrobiales bacterium]
MAPQSGYMIKHRNNFSLNILNRFAVVLAAGVLYPSFVLANDIKVRPLAPVDQSDNQAPAVETKIENEVAVFAGLDKITGRIIRFDVKVDETVQFGALQVTPKICYTRPATQTPQTTSFVEVAEVTLDRKVQPLFNGWMFAASPGLHAVEHAVYDVWLADCKSGEQFSEKPITTSNDDLGGRGFGNDTPPAGDAPVEEGAVPAPKIKPTLN